MEINETLMRDSIEFDTPAHVADEIALLSMLDPENSGNEICIAVYLDGKRFTFRDAGWKAMHPSEVINALMDCKILYVEAAKNTTGCNAFGINKAVSTRIILYAGVDKTAEEMLRTLVQNISAKDRDTYDKLPYFHVWLFNGDNDVILTPDTEYWIDDDYFNPPLGLKAKTINDAGINDEPQIHTSVHGEKPAEEKNGKQKTEH